MYSIIKFIHKPRFYGGFVIFEWFRISKSQLLMVFIKPMQSGSGVREAGRYGLAW